MKNYLFTSCRRYISSMFALFVLALTSLGLSAQTITISHTAYDGATGTTSSMASDYCLESVDSIDFSIAIVDAAGTSVSPLSMQSIVWSGPNGFSATGANPEIDMVNDTNLSGTYSVIATFNNGETVEDDLTLVFENTVEWTCPADQFAFPSLEDGDNCAIMYTFPGFQLDAINCIDENLEYCISILDSDGDEIAIATTSGATVTDNVANSGVNEGTSTTPAVNMMYEVNTLTATLPNFGDYVIKIDIKNTNSEIVSQCLVPLTAIESRNNLTCNDNVNFTLTNNCEGLVTPDMILEGQYCFDMFGLELEHLATGTELSGTGEVMISQPGTYMVTVTGQSGLSCWGEILAEDKSIPQVDCQENVTMYCSQTAFTPGASVCGYGKYTNSTKAATAAGADDEVVSLNLTSGAPISGTVKSAWLNLSASVADISALSFSLVSPAGTVVELADFGLAALADNHCERPNINVCFADDSSYKPYAQFFDTDQCKAQVNAYIGNFNPANPFSGFVGDNVTGSGSGAWELRLSSALAVTDIVAELIVLTNEGNLVTQGDIMQNMGCSSSDITVESEDEMLSDNCAGGNWSVVERTWTATNNTTELQNSCSQMITFLPWSLDDIIWPKSRDGVESDIVDCSELFDAQWNLNPAVADEDGIPTPALAGEPRVPFGDMCGNFQVTREDLVFELCGEYSKKVIRKWAILDWCTSEYEEYDQIIKIEDTRPIVMTCAPDSDEGIIVNDSEGNPIVDSNGVPLLHWPASTDGNQCAGTWEIEPPLVIDNACDAHTFDFTVEFLIANEDGEAPINGEFVSFDAATGAQVNGAVNPTSISNLPLGVTWLKYSVEDECGNTGVCFTEVAVTDQTRPTPVCIENTVVAIGDDGCAYLPAESIDNSSWDNCGIADYGISRSANGPFTDVLDYCCGCMMDDEMVYLQVTDAAGNTNICVVTVEVQNNTNPSVSGGPENESRSCTAGAYDLFAISEAGKATFNFTANCPNTAGFTVVATHNGNVIQSGDMFEPGECGAGSTSIKYDVTDACGGAVGGSFNQSLSYTNDFSGFDVLSWPVDYTIPNCVDGVEPENLPANAGQDAIRTTSSNCGSDTAISYDDQIFPDVVDACYKILRTWTVIDWCIVNAPGNTVDMGRRTYTQLIKVNDSTAPVITNLNDVFGDDPNCQYVLTADDLDYEITDNCTAPEDVQVSFLVNGEPTGNIFGNSYSNGDRITIEVADHCDNVNTFSFGIFTADTQAPTPYCTAEVITTPNADGIAEIWVSDFSQGADDNCDTDVDDYFINDLGQQTQVLSYDCEDIPNGVSELVPVTVYFEDDAGNINTCEVRLLLQDNDDVCPDQPGSRIAGAIQTADNRMVEDVMVELMRGGELSNSMMSTTNGTYAFDQVTHELDYSIMPHKEDSYLNGVSTIDLVMIQRHILGLERFDSPYDVMAADTDNNGRINGVDLVELRKLILGITTQLPNGQQSWRVPAAAQSFNDTASPFPYDEHINIANHSSTMNGQDFIAVKIGDVNGSAITSLDGGEVTTRSGQSLELQIADQSLAVGTALSVPVYAENMDDIIGLQTTISFNPAALQFAGITKAGLDVTESNLGLLSLKEGYISLSWNSTEGVTLDADQALFEIQFVATEAGNLSEQFYLSSALTGSEAYTDNMSTIALNLNVKGVSVSEFVLYQNIPNPFADNTEIRFSLPASSDVTFTIYDVNGKEIMKRQSRFDGGNNSILLNSSELTSSGVLYYKLDSAFGTASRKMIQIR